MLPAIGRAPARLALAAAVALGSAALVLVAASLEANDLDAPAPPGLQGAAAGPVQGAAPAAGLQGAAPAPGPSPPAAAIWAYRPASVSQMAGRSELIVVAAVREVERGRDLRPIGTTDDTGEGALPTQRIRFRVEEALIEPRIPAPLRFVLFRTGGKGAAGHPVSLEGDPPYEPGERYVLFLRARRAADGTLLPVAPDGRLRLTSDDTLEPLIEGPVADELRGRRLADLKAAIR